MYRITIGLADNVAGRRLKRLAPQLLLATSSDSIEVTRATVIAYAEHPANFLMVLHDHEVGFDHGAIRWMNISED